jgi:hypothetical protein
LPAPVTVPATEPTVVAHGSAACASATPSSVDATVNTVVDATLARRTPITGR